MAGTIDDQRNAVSIHTGISGQLMAASLVLIGVLLGYFDIRNIEAWSVKGFCLLLAIAALLVSIILGAIGLKKLRDNGNKGTWDYSLTHTHFRLQTLLSFIALILFFIIFFLKSESSSQEKQLNRLNSAMDRLIRIDSAQQVQLGRSQALIDSLLKHRKTSSKPPTKSFKKL
jgi:uncharacterized membrane protein YhaH (DUF805 family)